MSPPNSNADPLPVTKSGALKNVVKVLVIEDNDDDQRLLLRQLKKANIQEQVLLDLKLPGASGLEVLHFIRSKPGIAHLPVIVMTGSDNPKDLEECQRLKVISYISKPVEFQPFCMAIANVFHLPDEDVSDR